MSHSNIDLAGDSSSDVDSLIGQTLAGRFKLLELLGKGGSGAIYRAEHIILNNAVAIKVLAVSDPDKIRRFQREAKLLSSLQHPNIVSISSFGQDGERFFLVMDLLQGKTLEEVIKSEALSITEALSIAAQISAGLAYTHKAGIIHRDLKSSNIMIIRVADQAPSVRILDFGLSKQIEGEFAEQAHTASGAILGSPAYMSPEQCRCETLDERSDVYSFGCVFYEMLTGHTPFSGENALELMHKQANAMRPALSLQPAFCYLKAPLQLILDKCLAIDKGDRFQSSVELHYAIAELNTVLPQMTSLTNAGWRRRSAAVTFALLLCVLFPIAFWAKSFQHGIEKAHTGTTSSTDSAPLSESTAQWIKEAHFPKIRTRVEELAYQQKGDQAEVLLKNWLQKHSIQELEIDEIEKLTSLIQHISQSKENPSIIFSFYAPTMDKLGSTAKWRADTIIYQVWKEVLSSYPKVSIDKPIALNSILTRLHSILNDPHFQLKAELLTELIRTATDYCKQSDFENAEKCIEAASSEIEMMHGRNVNVDEMSDLADELLAYELTCMQRRIAGDVLEPAILNAGKLHLRLIESCPQDRHWRQTKSACLFSLSCLHSGLGQENEAIKYFTEGRRYLPDIETSEAEVQTRCFEMLTLIQLDRFAESEEVFKEIERLLAEKKIVAGGTVFHQLNGMADALCSAGRASEACTCQRLQIELDRRALGSEQVTHQAELAQYLLKAGKVDDAEKQLKFAKSEADKIFSESSRAFGIAEYVKQNLRLNDYWIDIFLLRGQNEAASKVEAQQTNLMRPYKATIKSNSIDYASSLSAVAKVELAKGNFSQALEQLSDSCHIHERSIKFDSMTYHISMGNLQSKQARLNDASDELERAFNLEKRIRTLANSNGRLVQNYIALSESCIKANRFELALLALQRTLSNAKSQKSSRDAIAEIEAGCAQATVLAGSQPQLPPLPQQLAHLGKIIQSAESDLNLGTSTNSAIAILLESEDATLRRLANEAAPALQLHNGLLKRCKNLASLAPLCMARLQFEIGEDLLALNNFDEAKKEYLACLSTAEVLTTHGGQCGKQAKRIAIEALYRLANIEIFHKNYKEAGKYNSQGLSELDITQRNILSTEVRMLDQGLNIAAHNEENVLASEISRRLKSLRARRANPKLGLALISLFKHLQLWICESQ